MATGLASDVRLNEVRSGRDSQTAVRKLTISAANLKRTGLSGLKTPEIDREVPPPNLRGYDHAAKSLNRIGSVVSHSKTPTLRRKRHGGAGLHLPQSWKTRTLLATLVGANKVTYQDTDGDTVSVTFSKSFLTKR